ncbi:hypothetical protein VE03_08226 [Pseudogymnoascus sp. 23342-1-I1]|nr:hypothetical protein VE03_08213 [Pseudogymnoascus sp. 23342-1-I1]OBT61925.1 hypothetical protein VE03_08226 [Pseudogymnoascus sp. 23342-1-I1]
MSSSDEKMNAASKAMEGHFGKDAPGLIGFFINASASEGVDDDDMYHCVIQAGLFLDNCKGLVDEYKGSIDKKLSPIANATLVFFLDNYIAKNHSGKDKD